MSRKAFNTQTETQSHWSHTISTFWSWTWNCCMRERTNECEVSGCYALLLYTMCACSLVYQLKADHTHYMRHVKHSSVRFFFFYWRICMTELWKLHCLNILFCWSFVFLPSDSSSFFLCVPLLIYIRWISFWIIIIISIAIHAFRIVHSSHIQSVCTCWVDWRVHYMCVCVCVWSENIHIP